MIPKSPMTSSKVMPNWPATSAEIQDRIPDEAVQLRNVDGQASHGSPAPSAGVSPSGWYSGASARP